MSKQSDIMNLKDSEGRRWEGLRIENYTLGAKYSGYECTKISVFTTI